MLSFVAIMAQTTAPASNLLDSNMAVLVALGGLSVIVGLIKSTHWLASWVREPVLDRAKLLETSLENKIDKLEQSTSNRVVMLEKEIDTQRRHNEKQYDQIGDLSEKVAEMKGRLSNRRN